MRLPSAILAILLSAAPAAAAERSFAVSDFTRLRATGAADVIVRTGQAPSARATGAEADLDRLVLEVRNGELVISEKSGSWSWSREGLTVNVTVPALESATTKGSGDIRVDRVKAPRFSAATDGSGDVALDSVDADTVSLAVSGSGDIRAAGRCETGSLAVNGSGDIAAGGLKCRTLSATVNGSGDIAAQATGTAAAAVNGSGDISITGGARCTRTSRGSGEIRCS